MMRGVISLKDYSKSIAYPKQEMAKQTEPHRKPYLDAIEAMEFRNPMKVSDRTSVYLHCPRYCKPEQKKYARLYGNTTRAKKT